MGRGRGLLSPLATLTLASLLAAAADHPPPPATSPAGDRELPAAALDALATITDDAFSFDQPGFYAVVAAVRASPHAPGFHQPPIEVDDWRDLLERPASFRGRPVTITGLVGRNKAPYLLLDRPDLGELSQLELRRADQPITCTLICTRDAADIPLNATIAATGYFVMIRQYHGPTNRPQRAALIVTPGPTVVAAAPQRAGATGRLDWRWLVGAIVFGLVVVIVLLRLARGPRRDVRTLRATRPAPMSLADDLQKWADRQPDTDNQEKLGRR